MADRTVKTGEAFVDIVPVFDFDQVSRVSGQVAGDFTVAVYKDGELAVGYDPAVSEIEGTGNYAFTLADGFPDVGFYVLDIQILYNESSWRIDVEVRVHDIDSVFYVLSGGYGTEEVLLTLVDTNQDDAPIVDALVNVLSPDGDTFVTFGRTDSAGQVVFALDEGDYTLRLYSPGYAFDVEAITVADGGLVQTITGASAGVDAPSNPEACRLYAYFYSMDGAAVEGFRVKASNLYDPSSVSGMSVIEGEQTVASDADGLVQVDVVQGTRLKVSFIGTKFTRTITVPSTPTASLLTLMGQNTDAFRVVRAS